MCTFFLSIWVLLSLHILFLTIQLNNFILKKLTQSEAYYKKNRTYTHTHIYVIIIIRINVSVKTKKINS